MKKDICTHIYRERERERFDQMNIHTYMMRVQVYGGVVEGKVKKVSKEASK